MAAAEIGDGHRPYGTGAGSHRQGGTTVGRHPLSEKAGRGSVPGLPERAGERGDPLEAGGGILQLRRIGLIPGARCGHEQSHVGAPAMSTVA